LGLAKRCQGQELFKGFFFPSCISLSKTKKFSVFQKDYILELGDTIVLECEKNPNCFQLDGGLSVFETWGSGK